MKEIWIANDHGGSNLKYQFIKYFNDKDISYRDLGCDNEQIVRYPYYAARIARAVSQGVIDKGILICSTGIGMSIMANKYKKVRASHCTSTYQARMTRAHNDSNILCLGGKISGDYEALDMLEVWLTTDFEGGRHNISLGLIAELENINMNDKVWEPEIPEKQ